VELPQSPSLTHWKEARETLCRKHRAVKPSQGGRARARTLEKESKTGKQRQKKTCLQGGKYGLDKGTPYLPCTLKREDARAERKLRERLASGQRKRREDKHGKNKLSTLRRGSLLSRQRAARRSGKGKGLGGKKTRRGNCDKEPVYYWKKSAIKKLTCRRPAETKEA